MSILHSIAFAFTMSVPTKFPIRSQCQCQFKFKFNFNSIQIQVETFIRTLANTNKVPQRHIFHATNWTYLFLWTG